MPYPPHVQVSGSVIGIDASARSTGIVIASPCGDTKEYLISPRKLKGSRRIAHIYESFEDILGESALLCAVMEGPSYNSANKPFILGEVYGIFKLCLATRGVPLYVVSPRAIKKYAVGSGSASKERLAEEALRQGCKSSSDDITDAWFIAKIARDIVGGSASNQVRKSQEVVAAAIKKGPE